MPQHLTRRARSRQRPRPGISRQQPPPRRTSQNGVRDVHGHERALVTRHRERYAAVQALLADGCSVREIARRLGLARGTAAKFAGAASIDELLVKATSRPSILDPFKAYINQRWNDGITSADVLQEEIRARGWKGDILTVSRYLRQFRTADGRNRQARTQPQLTAPVTPPAPKPRQIVRWIMTRPDHLTSDDAANLTRLLDAGPELAATAAHVRSFAAMMTQRQSQHLDEWIAGVRADPLPALHSFANGLCKDHNAVHAGLTLAYSSGVVEGKNCKIKHLKRLMYGRANLDLLLQEDGAAELTRITEREHSPENAPEPEIRVRSSWG